MRPVTNYDDLTLSADAYEEWWLNYALTSAEEGKAVPGREFQRGFGFAEQPAAAREAMLNRSGQRKHKRHNKVSGSREELRAAVAICAMLYGSSDLDARPSRSQVIHRYRVGLDDVMGAERLLEALGLLRIRRAGERVLYQEVG